MKDIFLSLEQLMKQENEIKASQSKQAHDLSRYLSEKIGVKLTPSETYYLSIEMYDTNPKVRFLMKNLEVLLKEQTHVTELISCINSIKSQTKFNSLS